MKVFPEHAIWRHIKRRAAQNRVVVAIRRGPVKAVPVQRHQHLVLTAVRENSAASCTNRDASSSLVTAAAAKTSATSDPATCTLSDGHQSMTPALTSSISTTTSPSESHLNETLRCSPDSESLSRQAAPASQLPAALPNSESPELLNTSTPDAQPQIPSHDHLADPSFVWGSVTASSFSTNISKAYNEIVHWKGNLFSVPSGNKGNQFVSELARLYRAYAEASALESVALKATTVMIILLLQRPHPRSQTKDHQKCLSRRLSLWLNGDIGTLLSEGRTIQDRLRFNVCHSKPRNLIKSFSDLMLRGKVRDALRLLSKSDDKGVLSLTDVVSTDPNLTVLDVLESKHPPAQPPNAQSLVHSDPNISQVHPVVFERIDAECIRKSALHTFGAGGPSRLDAYNWRRLCTSFGKASNDLCHSLAQMARRICSTHVHPDGLKPFLACRLIALDKNPGVRPIGICEVPRRIIAKAALNVIRCDVMEAVGSLQLCGGQIAGTEAAVHAVRSLFDSDECQGVLLVDASNAFNSLNRSTALLNIQSICPPISTILWNCYRSPTDLYVDGSLLYSQEGTTQGDPLAMPMYALATVPLISELSKFDSVSQTWYADDASACGKLTDVHSWWNSLSDITWPKIWLLPKWVKILVGCKRRVPR